MAIENQRHEYEPGDGKPRPMSSEPPCRVCGQSRREGNHNG